MKAVRIQAFGGSDQVRIEDLPMPEPGPGEALVRVRAAGLNPVDWMIREQIYNPPGTERAPLTLGQDFAGVIEGFGPGAHGAFREGDAVFGEAWGSFAEYACVPVRDLARKPAGLDFVTAAALPMAGLTAWQAVIDTAKAAPGMRFLIHGASGGVGSFAAQFARWEDAEVLGTAGRHSFDFLRSIGVERAFDYREPFEAQVRDVDCVLDPVGGETQARSWSVLRRGGMLINLVGDLDHAAARRVGAHGIEFAMRYDVEDLEEIAGLVEGKVVKPHITRVLPLAHARQALDLNQEGGSHGKLVLTVG
ncbi:MAG TPA: NADP-dependent oxidoreductase [Polyangia bacterium]|jgi:NADPH:quinone reductase-like Zn-dependent oxidoreductase